MSGILAAGMEVGRSDDSVVGGGVEPPHAANKSPMARIQAAMVTWLEIRYLSAKSRMMFRRCRGVLFLLAIANINCPFQPRISMSLLEKNWAWKAQVVIIRQKRQACMLAFLCWVWALCRVGRCATLKINPFTDVYGSRLQLYTR